MIKTLAFICAMCIASISYSQRAVDDSTAVADNLVATTAVEYNYATKGYKVQLESGLDTKAGYEIADFYTSTSYDNAYEFNFKYLFRLNNQTDPLAAIIVVAKSKSWGNTYYVCIPFGDVALQKQYLAQISGLDSPMRLAYAMALSEMVIINTKGFIITSMELEKLKRK